MKKIMCLSILLMSMIGCTSTYHIMQGGYPAAVSPAFVFSDDVVYPYKDSQTVFNLERKDYVILGQVSTELESTNILYLYSSGDNGYGKILKIARQRYPNANALMNVYWDSKIKQIGWPYPPIPIFQKVTSQVTAIAVSLK